MPAFGATATRLHVDAEHVPKIPTDVMRMFDTCSMNCPDYFAKQLPRRQRQRNRVDEIRKLFGAATQSFFSEEQIQPCIDP